VGGGEDARKRCHCQKTLTPPDEASVDASTHNTAQNTRARTPAAVHTLSEHTQGPNAHARRVPSDGRWAPGTLHARTRSCAAMQHCRYRVLENSGRTYLTLSRAKRSPWTLTDTPNGFARGRLVGRLRGVVCGHGLEDTHDDAHHRSIAGADSWTIWKRACKAKGAGKQESQREGLG